MGNWNSRNNAELHPYDKSFDPFSGQDAVDPLPNNSLKDFMRRIHETNQIAVTSLLQILDSKRDIKKNHHLFDLVLEYYSNSFHMSVICNKLEDCLRRSRDRQLILSAAVENFRKEEKECINGAQDKQKYIKALEELKIFQNTENPLAVIPQTLKDVREQYQSLVEKLRRHERKIKSKLAYLNAWRLVSGTILATAAITLFICEAVVAVAGMNEVADVLGGVALGSVALGSGLESQYQRYHNDLKREIRLIYSMKERAQLVELMDFNEIQVQSDRLEKQLESLMNKTDFALRGKEVAKLVFQEIEKSMEKFMKTLEELAQCVSTCSNHLKKGRLAIQGKINKY